MKKILILAVVAVLVLVAAVMPVVAAEPAPERGNYVDADKNGVCDNRERRESRADTDTGTGIGTCGRGENFVDADGDGVCDNAGDRGTGICGNGGGEKKQWRYRGGRGC